MISRKYYGLTNLPFIPLAKKPDLITKTNFAENNIGIECLLK